MEQNIKLITLLVDDYDKAIEFYTTKLKFELAEDTERSSTKRWVRVTPKGGNGPDLLLAKADNEVQTNLIGKQGGGRVFLFLFTDNIKRDHKNLVENCVKIAQEPIVHEYGTVLIFEDLYGNRFDLIEPIKKTEITTTYLVKLTDLSQNEAFILAISKIREVLQKKESAQIDLQSLSSINESKPDHTYSIVLKFPSQAEYESFLKAEYFKELLESKLIIIEQSFTSEKISI